MLFNILNLLYGVQDGRRLISVILKGQPRQYFLDSKELLNFGFRSFQNMTIADHESRYVTGDELIRLDSGSYKASELHIEPDRMITLPINASFEDADISLEALPADAPKNAVALLRYTYNDRVIGEACLMTDANPVQIGAASGEEHAESNTAPAADNKTPDSDTPSAVMPIGMILLVILVAAIILLLGGGLGWIIYSRKKEAEEQARRRERRRQRLAAEGDDAQAEFERLMKERWNR